MSNLDPTAPDVSRRTIIKAAAWSVPAVMVAGAVPAYAATGSPPDVVFDDMCKLPGASCAETFVKGYLLQIVVTNNSDKDQYLYNEAGFLITIEEDNPDISLFFQAAVDVTNNQIVSFPYLLPVGASVVLLINAGENGSSANEELNVTLTLPWGHTPTPPDPDNHPPVVLQFFVPSTPPVQNPGCIIEIPPVCD